MAIEAASATSNSNTPGHHSSSDHGKTVGIAVGVTIPIVVIVFIAVFVYFRRKKQSPVPEKSSDFAGGQVQNARQRETNAELDAASTIHELAVGSDRRHPDRTDTSQSLPQFAAEKETYPRDRSEMVELTGDHTISQSAPLLGPVHEMYGSPPIAPVELPVNEPTELPGSSVTRNDSSAGSSSFYGRSRGLFQSRSSTPGFLPSPTSGAASPDPLVRGPSTSNRTTTSSPPGNDVLSPISPIAEVEHSTSSGGWGSLWRVISQPRRPTGRTRDDRQANPGNG